MRLPIFRYKTKEMFYEEVRLVFDNCQAFNMDDSFIGRAGHALRSYFESRCSEVDANFDLNMSVDEDDENHTSD